MADEATITTKLRFAKGDIDVNLDEIAATFTVAGTKYLKYTQIVGFAAAEALYLGDVGVGGYVLMKNNDSTNFVQLNGATGEAMLVRLEPGDVALFRVDDDAVPFAQADTANVELEYLLIEA